ncbi:Mannose-1-phosphate guanylyltransferase 1 [Pseudoalteromonas sp. P1-9]|nr:Mannose-1-phosphate guanylyltransferase 1 [Pseudoalteromonas sp. P1-9]
MLQETALRLKGFNNPIAVCNESHRFILAEQLSGIGKKPSALILEPVARNTAPAIALAAFQAQKMNDDAILVVLAADHVISDEDAFQKAVELAVSEAEKGSLVTFGVVPNKAETGFGYIQATEKEGVSAIKRFVEKPDFETAASYVDSGDYFWNSGMFVFKASSFLNELKEHNSDMFDAVNASLDNADSDLDFIRVKTDDFAKSPSDSIDYAIMEKTSNGVVLPINVGWSDVGSFSALWEVLDKDENGNVGLGDIKYIDSKNCLVQSENQFVATIGVEDIVVVGTKDSVLVTKRDRVQDVKAVVSHLEATGRTEHLLHREVHRPWGKYDSIDNGNRYQVKRITVKPGASLSKQMHHHRAEHWIVVSGTAIVEINDKETLLCENQSIYIPLGATHRLTNPGKVQLELIEVQSGSYLGEDDIVRFKDEYGRS